MFTFTRSWKTLISLLTSEKPPKLIDLEYTLQKCFKSDSVRTIRTVIYCKNIVNNNNNTCLLASVLLYPKIKSNHNDLNFYNYWNEDKYRGGLIRNPKDIEVIRFYFLKHFNSTIPEDIVPYLRQSLEHFDNNMLLYYRKEVKNILNLIKPSRALSGSVCPQYGIYTYDVIELDFNASTEYKEEEHSFRKIVPKEHLEKIKSLTLINF